MTSIKLITLNAKGPWTPEKRVAMFRDLRKLKAQILFFQEMHFQKGKYPWIPDKKFNKEYYSGTKVRRCRGVSIYMSATLNWTLDIVQKDKEGRWVIIKGLIIGKTTTLVNIYSANWGQMDFLANVLEETANFTEGTTIIGGDFNMILKPSLDTTAHRSHFSYAVHKKIKQQL